MNGPAPRAANLFDLLRIIAAGMVIVGHAWPLTGTTGVPRLAGISIHHLGVYCFFVISGYLLATTLARDSRALPFMIRRCLRILPALIVVVVCTVFVLGPIASTAEGYWGDPLTWRYLLNVTLVAQYELPGVFADNPSAAVNGSLWSLGPEFCCYLMLVLLGALGVRASVVCRAAVAIALAAMIVLVPFTGPLRTTAAAVVFFLLGSLVAHVMPVLTGRAMSAAALVGGAVLVALTAVPTLPWWVGLSAAWIALPCLIVGLGRQPSALASRVRRLGDPSYGMYLWAFPVQQASVSIIPTAPIVVHVLVVTPIAALFGYASWWLVERPAIRRGRALSGR